MAYNNSYDSTDVGEATINTVAVFIITVASLATVIVLIMLFGWAKKRFPKV
jgi:ABC-type lipoprotein release transport system permease subunit